MQGGSNMPRVADYNRVLIVDLVRRHPGISRVELAERTGLTAQTVTNICTFLGDQGLIAETGRTPSPDGRWRTVYEVVPAGRYAVGLHIDAVHTVLALVDLAGTVIDRVALTMPDSDDPADVLDAVADATRALVAANDVPDGALAGLGVATPGPLRMAEGTVVGAPNLRGWADVPLREGLVERLGIPVVLEKDTVAAATGELWAGTAPSDDFLFVYVGTGSGSGVVLGGDVMHGASGNLGNFGHISGDPDGPRCECGGRGCIAATATPVHLVEEAVRTGVLTGPVPSEAAEIEARMVEVADRASVGDAGAMAVLEHAARIFGRVASNLVNMLDLDGVVFGGPLWHLFAEPFMRIVPGVVDDLHIFRQVHGVTVVASSLGADVGPVGAASLVLANAVSARPSMLLADVR